MARLYSDSTSSTLVEFIQDTVLEGGEKRVHVTVIRSSNDQQPTTQDSKMSMLGTTEQRRIAPNGEAHPRSGRSGLGSPVLSTVRRFTNEET